MHVFSGHVNNWLKISVNIWKMFRCLTVIVSPGFKFKTILYALLCDL